MQLEILQPIEDYFVKKKYLPQTIGGQIIKHTLHEGMPELNNIQIALISIVDADSIMENSYREYFYNLFFGNWKFTIADLGNIPEGKTDEDTFFVVKGIVFQLLKKGITPIIIGGKQEVTYSIYRAFDRLEQMVNLVTVDALLDFGNEKEIIDTESYMSRILMETPNNLNNYTNIGYQTYYNAQESLDLLQKMYFEGYRLGEVTHYMEMVEPILRNADIVSMDLTCVQASDLDSSKGFVNGFTNREICTISRYAGLSMQTSVFGVFNIPKTIRAKQLTGQILWYFLEGYNFRIKGFPTTENINFTKYIVLIEEFIIEFYKSNHTGRWWILPSEQAKGIGMLPCTEKDYQKACEGIIPERWWNLHQRSFF